MSKLDISNIIDPYIIQGTKITTDGFYEVSWEKLKYGSGVDFKRDLAALGSLIKFLNSYRDAMVKSFRVEEDVLVLEFYAEYCQKFKDSEV